MTGTSQAYVIDTVRSAVGKRNGSLAGVHPVDLGAAAWRGRCPLPARYSRCGMPFHAARTNSPQRCGLVWCYVSATLLLGRACGSEEPPLMTAVGALTSIFWRGNKWPICQQLTPRRLDASAQISAFVKLKLANCARAGTRPGHFFVSAGGGLVFLLLLAS